MSDPQPSRAITRSLEDAPIGLDEIGYVPPETLSPELVQLPTLGPLSPVAKGHVALTGF